MKHPRPSNGTNRLAGIALMALAALSSIGCSAGEQADADSTTTAPVGGVTTTRDADAESAQSQVTVATAPAVPVTALEAAAQALSHGVVLEVHDMGIEESGVQMRVERIEQRHDATLVRLAIVNGAEDEKQVPHHEVATLTLPDGTVHETTAAFPTRGVELETGEQTVVVLAFPPTSGPFDLEVGFDGLVDDPFSPMVGFRFDDLDPDRVTSGLHADTALAAVGTHPNGSQIELKGIRFTPDRIGVDIDFRNGLNSRLWLFGADETYLEDDLGNRHRALVEPNGPTFFELPAESSLSGVLTFAGRMDPRATSYTIMINDGGLLTNRLATSPAFVLGPFEVGDAQSIEVPTDVSVDVTIDQVAGSTATLSGFRFDDETIRAEVSIINEGDDVADFNAGLTYVVDSEGITYRSKIEELPELVLEPGQGFEGELVFTGRLQPAATSVRLTVNHGGLQRHSFFFDPIDVTRSAQAAELTTFEVEDWSSFAIGTLETTSVSAIAVAIAEFDGVEVDGGVLLTLPETILFDFGRSELRPEAASSVELVADILAYYEGDDVQVIGHTDSVGDDASNQALSEARAGAVFDALVAQGVPVELLTVDGRGEREPVAANQHADGSDDPAGRQLNRRVEIFIETDRGMPTD